MLGLRVAYDAGAHEGGGRCVKRVPVGINGLGGMYLTIEHDDGTVFSVNERYCRLARPHDVRLVDVKDVKDAVDAVHIANAVADAFAAYNDENAQLHWTDVMARILNATRGTLWEAKK